MCVCVCEERKGKRDEEVFKGVRRSHPHPLGGTNVCLSLRLKIEQKQDKKRKLIMDMGRHKNKKKANFIWKMTNKHACICKGRDIGEVITPGV